MYYYVFFKGNQIKKLIKGDLERVETDCCKLITEEQYNHIKSNGLQSFLYDNNGLRLKPEGQLSLSKPQIASDGADSVTLEIDIITATQINSADILFNGNRYTIPLTANSGTLPITSTTPGEITIELDRDYYRFTPVVLEVV